VTWLTWRQFRAQAATAAVALAAFAILLAVTGPHLAGMYASSGIKGCHAGSCYGLVTSFFGLLGGTYTVVYTLGLAAVVLAPAAIGIFWGAPLVAREFETGTFRLAWTQTVTRLGWLASKLAIPGLTAMAVAEGLSLMYGWWAAPIGQAARVGTAAFPLGMSPFSLPAFDAHGLTPLGYAAFAFALGVTAGVLIRRQIAAMAVTLAVFAVVQVAMPLWVRPHLFPPAHSSVSLSGNFSGLQSVSPGGSFTLALDHVPSEPGAWIYSSQAVDAAGHPVRVMPASCLHQSDSLPCLASHGFRVEVTYLPTSRYWALQWTETGIYLVVALALAGYCCWRLSRRPA
jgi:hypothetical protein